MFYGATGRRLSLPERECTVWNRMKALGLEFLGPQAPTVGKQEQRRTTCRATRKRADVLQERRWAGNGGESTGLRIRVARLPQEGVGACDERNP